MFLSKSATIPIMAILLSLGGCFSAPEQLYRDREPALKPVRNVTRLDAALACVDRQLAEAKLPPIYVTSRGLPNRAGDKVTISSGIDMLQQAISEMSKTSNVFRFVDLSAIAPSAFVANTDQKLNDHTLIDPVAINGWIEKMPKTADFYRPQWDIDGSISQIDDNVISESRGGSFSFMGVDFGLSRDQVESAVGLDLRLVDWNSRQLRNGSAISHAIAVLRAGSGVNVGARIASKTGAHVDVSNETNQSGGQALRTLIQFSAIKLLGELAGVPYQRCLGLDTPPDYAALVNENETVPAAPPLRLVLASSRGVDDPLYKVGESLDFSLTVNQPAHVHCYITVLGSYQIFPIFPNLAQPNARLEANRPLRFALDYQFDRPGVERLACVAGAEALVSPWGYNPDVAHAAPLPIQNVQELDAGYRQQTRGVIRFETLTYKVFSVE